MVAMAEKPVARPYRDLARRVADGRPNGRHKKRGANPIARYPPYRFVLGGGIGNGGEVATVPCDILNVLTLPGLTETFSPPTLRMAVFAPGGVSTYSVCGGGLVMPKGIWPRPSAETRFWEGVQKTDGCWLWTKARDPHGYAHLWVDKRLMGIHRFSYVLANGPIPDGLWVLHRCDVRHCVNPAHLFLGTPQDNVDDMVRKGRQAQGDRSSLRLYPELVKRGEAHYKSTLTTQQVRDIRRLASEGMGVKEIAARYGKRYGYIWMVVHRTAWAWLED